MQYEIYVDIVDFSNKWSHMYKQTKYKYIYMDVVFSTIKMILKLMSLFTFVSLLSNINTSNKSIGVLVNSNNTKLNGVLVNRHTT